MAIIDSQIPETARASQSSHLKFFQADVSDESQVAAAASGILAWKQERNMDIGGIVCCAGYLGPMKILSKSGKIMPLDHFRKVVNISLTGTLDVIRQLLPAMASQRADEDGERGVIVTVASAAAFDGQEGQLAYSAAKGAIASMTLPLARDLSQWGIRAVSIAPGMFGTNMVAGMSDKVKESLQRSLEFPARAGRPEEFASLVQQVFENRMLNGTVIRLDGASRMPSRL